MAHPLAHFDLDNTLIDRQKAFRHWAIEWQKMNDLPADAIQWLIANDRDGYRPRVDLMLAAAEQFELDCDPEDLVNQYRQEFPTCFAPDAAVIERLRQLQGLGWRMVVVTNGSRTQRAKLASAGLASAGLAAEFDTVLVSEEVGERKPSPAIFRPAVETVGSQMSAGWMVGDNPVTDIQGAAEVALNTIWIAAGREWSLPEVCPCVVVQSIHDAFTHLV